MNNILIVPLTVVLDLLFGDPPNAFHPVAWFGIIAQAVERRAPRDSPRAELLYGTAMTAGGIALALPALAIERVLRGQGQPRGLPLRIFAMAVLLKMTFAWRGLIWAGKEVQRDLETHATDNARADLRALVSRDTRELDASQLSAAAIESLAENASDSFVAPVFYYHLFGLPGAFAYRAVNTLDSMIGYHGRYEYLGKFAARVDDTLNFLPARLTAILLIIAARLTQNDARCALQTMRRDHARTESPNAGYPMSAMAGALDVRLEKVGRYRLNECGRAPQPRDIQHAADVVSVALGLAVTFSVIVGTLAQIIKHRSKIRNVHPATSRN